MTTLDSGVTTQITVGIADCKVSRDPAATIVTYALGSCIAVAIYDPHVKVGGMIHFMLPEFTADSARGQANPMMYADTGLPLLLQQLIQMGASKHRLVVRAAGGAQVLAGAEVFSIGKRNHLSLRKTLWKLGCMLHAEAIGGSNSRSLRLEIGTGRVTVREGMQGEHEMTVPARLKNEVRA